MQLHVQSAKTQLDRLAQSITNLADSTAAQMQSINATAAIVRNDLRAAASYRQPDLELWNSIAERLVHWILASPCHSHCYSSALNWKLTLQPISDGLRVGSAFSSIYVQTTWLVLRGAWSLLCSSATVLFTSRIPPRQRLTLFGTA